MNFNAFGIKVTMTAALVAGTMAIASMPAQAASLIADKKFSFYGSATLLSETATNTTLDFMPSYSNPNIDGQASVAKVSEIGTYNQQFTLSDIPLLKTVTGWSLATGTSLNWIKADAGLPFQYTLTKFNLAKTFDTDGVLNGFTASMGGFFTESGSNFASINGFFSSQPELVIEGDSFSASLRAAKTPTGDPSIPTPALLPGLIGLGASIVRKKRQAIAA
jgi:hypothetical protein